MCAFTRARASGFFVGAMAFWRVGLSACRRVGVGVRVRVRVFVICRGGRFIRLYLFEGKMLTPAACVIIGRVVVWFIFYCIMQRQMLRVGFVACLERGGRFDAVPEGCTFV